MNRSFVIPAALALLLHSMLFIGSGRPPNPRDGNPRPKPADDDPPDQPTVILLQKFEEIIEAEKNEMQNQEKPGGGSNEEAPFTTPDIPNPGPVDLLRFTQEPVKVNPGTSNKIPTGFTGWGKGEGDGPGAAIIGSAFLDNPPATRRQTPPVYPHSMKVGGVEGTVWVEFIVDEHGRVNDLRVTKTTNDSFNEATIHAVSTWRFEPGKRKGLPVRFRMTIPIVFSLSD